MIGLAMQRSFASALTAVPISCTMLHQALHNTYRLWKLASLSDPQSLSGTLTPSKTKSDSIMRSWVLK